MKIKHLLKPLEFSDIFMTGIKIKGNYISLYWKKDTLSKDLTVGVIVSKKMASKAVIRNYIKRRVYAYFREVSDSLRGTKVIVRVQKGLKDQKRKDVLEIFNTELAELAKQIKNPGK